jgi:hypothetical protein
MRPLGAVVLASMCMTGCSRSPSINVLGAYFPDWLFCIVAGVVVTIVLHAVAQRTHHSPWLEPQALVYPALVALIALLVWLIFFQH